MSENKQLEMEERKRHEEEVFRIRQEQEMQKHI